MAREQRRCGWRYRERSEAEVNLTPLIDPIIIILLLFCLSFLGMRVDWTLGEVQLPQGKAQMQSGGRGNPIPIVQIRQDGTVLLDGTAMALGEISRKLSTYRPPAVLLEGDGRAPLEVLVNVQLALGEAGVKRISFAGVPEPEEK